MNSQILIEAQGFLTGQDGISERKITDLIALSKNHDEDEMILFLCDREIHRLIISI